MTLANAPPVSLGNTPCGLGDALCVACCGGECRGAITKLSSATHVSSFAFAAKQRQFRMFRICLRRLRGVSAIPPWARASKRTSAPMGSRPRARAGESVVVRLAVLPGRAARSATAVDRRWMLRTLQPYRAARQQNRGDAMLENGCRSGSSATESDLRDDRPTGIDLDHRQIRHAPQLGSIARYVKSRIAMLPSFAL